MENKFKVYCWVDEMDMEEEADLIAELPHQPSEQTYSDFVDKFCDDVVICNQGMLEKFLISDQKVCLKVVSSDGTEVFNKIYNVYTEASPYFLVYPSNP